MPTQRSLHASPKGDRAGVLRRRDGPAFAAQGPTGPAVPPGPSMPAAAPAVAPTAAWSVSGTLASAAAPVSRLASTSRARWCEVCGVRCGWRVALGGGLVRGQAFARMSASPPGSAGGSVRVCSRSGSSRTARAGFHRAAARRNTRRGSVSSSLCVRLVVGAGGKPAPPPHAAGARGFFGSLPRLLLAVHELSHEGRTLGLADDEAAPHHVRALRRPDTGPARGYLPAVPSGAR